MFVSCWDTSRRVLICSETTPKARKPAQASPAPRPNLLVKEEAIQSVESAEADRRADLLGFCCCTLTGDGGSAAVALSGWDGSGVCGCGFWFGGWEGGGVWEDEEKLVLVIGWDREGVDPKRVAMFLDMKWAYEWVVDICSDSTVYSCSKWSLPYLYMNQFSPGMLFQLKTKSTIDYYWNLSIQKTKTKKRWVCSSIAATG